VRIGALRLAGPYLVTKREREDLAVKCLHCGAPGVARWYVSRLEAHAGGGVKGVSVFESITCAKAECGRAAVADCEAVVKKAPPATSPERSV
jgi:hypothetical protein